MIDYHKDMKVLFVCNANAARSQVAQGLYNHLTGSENAQSAGVGSDMWWDEAPSLVEFEKISQRPARSSETMAEIGIDISGQKRQFLTPDMLKNYDLVVNIAEKSQTPDWLKEGDNVIWWDISDPRNQSDEKNRIAREEIRIKVEQLIRGEIVDDTKE